MGLIKKLEPSVINRIAAGEIINRAENVVKELLENSLDAGATLIQIQTKDGGLKMIQIQDNGKGILKDDLGIVCERFTTSKLRDYQELSLGKVNTFGFRGEALASITHIAHVTLVSRTEDSPVAWKSVNGHLIHPPSGKHKPDEVPQPKPTAGNVGTQITIEDLFYNIPTRQKAFKNTSEEYNRILDVVQRYAIHKTGIGFVCKKAGSSTCDVQTHSKSTRLDTVKGIFGNAISKELADFEMERPDFAVTGLVSNASYSLKKREFILFINNRLVDCSDLKKSADAVYQKYLAKGSHSFMYLALAINPEHVDVNVHPTKKEVYFLHQDQIIQEICGELDAFLKTSSQSRTFYTQPTLPEVLKPVVDTQPNRDRSPAPVTSSPSNASVTNRPSSQSTKTPAQMLVRTDSRTRTLDSFIELTPSGPLLKRTKSESYSQAGAVLSHSINSNRYMTALALKDVLGRVDSPVSWDNRSQLSCSSQLDNLDDPISQEPPLAPQFLQSDSEDVTAVQAQVEVSTTFLSSVSESQKLAAQAPIQPPTTEVTSQLSKAHELQETLDVDADEEEKLKGDGEENLEAKETLDVDVEDNLDADDFPEDCKEALSGVMATLITKADKVFIPIHLTSVLSLRHEIIQQENTSVSEMFRNHTFVGCFNQHLALIQHNTNLLIVNYRDLSLDLCYQLAIFGFSNFGTIRLSEPLAVRELVLIALEAIEDWNEDENQPKPELANQVAELLLEKSRMIHEYFSILISEEGYLLELPVLISGMNPCLAKLPSFLLTLGASVDWTSEKDCFEGIAVALAHFYAYDFVMEGSEMAFERSVELELFPCLRQAIGQEQWLENQLVRPIANLSDLYKIFERC
ncbi:DNA mismatch repair protein [Kappamyces sp. JEL0829]|nr:DNA mismatch repair protein [Kappamyces sp. JEL0829]